MKKIISLFKRNYEGNRLVYNEVVEGAEWVLKGEGHATIKYDGTCCMVKEGKLYKRYDAKKGKVPPENFIPAQVEADKITGHWPGWVPVGNGPEDKWHREAFCLSLYWKDGTYELVGPKIQKNPYSLKCHQLWNHGYRFKIEPPRDFEGIKAFLKKFDLEGIVWYRENGDMVKIKRKDFGYKWPVYGGE